MLKGFAVPHWTNPTKSITHGWKSRSHLSSTLPKLKPEKQNASKIDLLAFMSEISK
jgi:hypothetical protein